MEKWERQKTRPGHVNIWIITKKTKLQLTEWYDSKDTLRIHLLGVHNYTLYLIMGGRYWEVEERSWIHWW